MAEQFVVDASVAAKWFLKDSSEAHADLADDILIDLLAGDVDLHAPRVMSYEVCRLLWKACLTPRRGADTKRLETDVALDCVRLLFDIPLHFANATPEESSEAIEMGVRYYKNYYDMTYLRLADELDCRVLTADEKLLLSAPSSFPLHRFLRLADYHNRSSGS